MPPFGTRVDVPGGRRRTRRQPVVLPAAAVAGGWSRPVILEDVCSTGARLRGRELPAHGAQMLLKVGVLDLMASVAWSEPDKCGITFDTPLDWRGVEQLKSEGRSGKALCIL